MNTDALLNQSLAQELLNNIEQDYFHLFTTLMAATHSPDESMMMNLNRIRDLDDASAAKLLEHSTHSLKKLIESSDDDEVTI